MQKNDLLRLTIEDLAADCEGVAHQDGMAVFVPGALPGESVTARCTKVQKRLAYARLLTVESASRERQSPPCAEYAACGGCVCQHMTYARTLAFKRQKVRSCLERIGGVDIEVPPVIGMDEPFRYRNKTALPVAEMPGGARAGFYAPRSHRLTPIDTCLVARQGCDEAARGVLAWMRDNQVPAYDEDTRTGLIRHVVTRVSRAGRVMVTVCANAESLPCEDKLADTLAAFVPGLCSVCVSPNTTQSNVILGGTYRVIRGDARLPDTLCGLRFSLSPLSFFQINPEQTERLYGKALEFAQLDRRDTALDLYCGAGTITLLAARAAGRVVGVESVPEAVRDARENARENGITNAEFICAQAERALPELVAGGMRPSAVLLDPPRKGAEESVLRAILHAEPSRVVYVSCDPATQARDAKILCEGGYRAAACQSVDMFCWTSKVENVLLFERKESL